MHGVDADPDVVAINPSDPHELPAWMGSTRGAVPTPRVRTNLRTFFPPGKSAKNPLKRFPQQLHEEAMRDQDLGDEGHHEELECQRAAPNSLLNSVLGENLENLQKIP